MIFQLGKEGEMFWLFTNVFFHRERVIFLCICFMLISYIGESCWGVDGLFSASGTIFTLSGLMLNIKATNIFHLKISYESKSDIVDGAGIFGSSISEEEAKEKVRPVELDEISGLVLIIFGTLLWGYGAYLIKYIHN